MHSPIHSTRLVPLLLLSAVARATPPAPFDQAADGATPEMWAGRIAIFGTRKIPLLGTVEFRTDNYLLGTVSRTPGRIVVDQWVCSVNFEKALGATVSMDPTGPAAMPRSQAVFHEGPEGGWAAPPWPSGWDESDLDKDGHPGIAITVKAPFCGGKVHMKTYALSEARMVPMNGALAGTIDIFNEQYVLGASGACLTLLAKDHSQWMEGRLSYVPVPAGTTCENAPSSAWPDPMGFAPHLPKSR